MASHWRGSDVVALVGFYGCHVGSGTVVRVAWSGPNRQSAPRFKTVDCPGCGNRHKVQLMWRRPSSAQELEMAMVKL